ncbi:early endosome antigen 1-like [Ochlerotatus camptorhynchus]|uniref:early endosome antigen 1-like n=1 Tax=Ochlerotatus camptorhynchus TaxID=644619 RepID=UPI0031DDFD51
MSYTTQQEFFNVPFRNEDPNLPDRKRSDGALMTYDLCTDSRAWALDKQKRSNYILDVVHKARFKKALLHPEGQFELTKGYLIQLDADDLADYILSLQAEIKRKNDSVQTLEESRKGLGEQLQAIQKQSDELTEIRQQSAILEQERTDFEQQMEDLEMVIVNLKDRADRYDLLAKENELLRQQLQKQRVEAADRIRLINAEAEANFNRMQAEDCWKLEAELILYKAKYEDLRHQKRELKEQLQKAFVQQSNLTELKRQLALEQVHREKVEDELEHVLSLYDQQFQEVDRENFAAIEELEVQRSQRWSENRSLSAGEEAEARQSSATAELAAKRCGNCQQMEEDLESLRRVQMEELQERERLNQELQEQVESLRKELELVEIATGGNAQSSKLMEELKQCQEEIRINKESEQEAQSQIALLEKNLAQVNTKLAEETKQIEQLEAAAKSIVSIKAEPRESVDNEIDNLQKMLEDAQAELAEKVEKIDLLNEENTRLQSAVVQHLDEVGKLEVIQQQQLVELETSKSELAQTKEQMTLLGGAELDDLKKLNDELQQEVARLQKEELVATQSLSRGALESVESQAELLKTVENLRAELQNANEAVKEREDVIGRLEVEVDAIRSVQQLGGIDLSEIGEENMQQERQKLEGRIKELEEKLQQCEGQEGRQERIGVVEGVDLPKILTVESKESVESGEEMLNILEEEVLERRDSMKRKSVGSGGQVGDRPNAPVQASEEMAKAHVSDTQWAKLESAVSVETIKAVVVEAERSSSESTMSDVEDEQVYEPTDEDAYESEEDKEVTVIGVEENVKEHAVKDCVTKKRSVTDKLPQQMAQLEQTGFLDDDIIRIGTSNPDKTSMIAIKIVRHGISMLVIAELDHLHREICRAIIERYLMLGQNVKAIDKAMYECNQILDSVKKMSNSEMKSMLASTETQVPIRNTLLLDDDTPIRLPAKPKARPKSTSFTMDQQGQKAPGRILVGDYNERPRDPFASLIASNIQGRIKVDDICRTRPWRAPKTPTETFVASTLWDGSRVVTRQKRYV